ncbi:hypothetical protein Esi_0393_0019 [Ectocarpus siliculosus]|uniref:Uncharacterized protein n=1 Tax=Ectocarpus siliculosus TaxID=2880 RepID=D7G046_ECTSI|nr:hypothetical protein Esi_0393_0019 [Ectocarpus siliculosus]|eukprot:CBJ32928.1 hypothetical protein Esi_0393_0019 [Ectocarpus siliculosus]
MTANEEAARVASSYKYKVIPDKAKHTKPQKWRQSNRSQVSRGPTPNRPTNYVMLAGSSSFKGKSDIKPRPWRSTALSRISGRISQRSSAEPTSTPSRS